MTREEMIDALEELKTKNLVEGSEDSERIDYVLNNTLDSLEMWKLPVKDAVSREDAKAKKIYSKERREYVVPVCELDWLPPVYPKAKVGKWIYHQSCGYNEIIDEWYECSECGRGFSAMNTSKENILKDYPYCHCGAKMKSQE